MRGYNLKDLQRQKRFNQNTESLDHIIRIILPDLKKVEECIFSSLDSKAKLIRQVSSYLLESGGKRIRPSILLLIARLGGYQGERAVRLATAIEFIHTATLLHDDIIDNSKTRRGSPTVNARWGNEVSVLAGDYMHSKAVTIFVEDNDPRLLSILAETTLLMTEGEIMEIERRDDHTISEEDYFAILYRKTAKLITAAAETGALLASFPKKKYEAISRFAEKTGIAFQLVDDTLDFLADDKEWGKPVGKDLKEGNITLPIIRLLAVANDEDRDWLVSVIKNKQYDDSTMQKVNNLLAGYEVFNYCFARAKQIIQDGKQNLYQFPESPEFVALLGLADFFIHRVY